MTGQNVALEGGPLDGWWYTVADWHTARGAAIGMGRTQDLPQGYVLGYEPTDRIVSHKRLDATAAVWRWQS